MNNLKQCPFCGYDAEGEAYKQNEKEEYGACVICKNLDCAARIKVWHRSSIERAIQDATEVWNTRKGGEQ